MSSGKQYTHLFADTIKIALFMCIKLQAYRESIRILISGEKGCSEYIYSAALLEKNTHRYANEITQIFVILWNFLRFIEN